MVVINKIYTKFDHWQDVNLVIPLLVSFDPICIGDMISSEFSVKGINDADHPEDQVGNEVSDVNPRELSISEDSLKSLVLDWYKDQ